MATSIRLRAQDGLYVSAENIQQLIPSTGLYINVETLQAKSAGIDESAKFTVIDPDNPTPVADANVCIQAQVFKSFLSAENGGGGTISFTQSSPGSNEIFRIKGVNGATGPLTNGQQVAIQTWDGQHYFSALGGGNDDVRAEASAINTWETFTLELLGPGPIFGYQLTENIDNNQDFRMASDVTFSDSGMLTMQTHIWTDSNLSGFKGAVAAFIIDKAGNVIGNTSLYIYGVGFPGATDRSIPETCNLDQKLYAQTSFIQILHWGSPQDKLRKDIESGIAIGKEAAELYKLFS